jgi:hypothetical protein
MRDIHFKTFLAKAAKLLVARYDQLSIRLSLSLTRLISKTLYLCRLIPFEYSCFRKSLSIDSKEIMKPLVFAHLLTLSALLLN